MPVRSSSFRAAAGCALTPLALCLSHAVWAQAAPAAGEKSLSTVTVTVNASADASAEGLSPPYAGGQVARGGRAGILGTRDNMETPFSITSYTNELIQDRQAKSVGEVLLNDPSVRTARGFGNFQEAYFVRGFILNSDDTAYNGLYSLLPRQYIATELFERVEVLRGASAFLTGASPNGSLGGAINLLPKRAPNEALSRVTLGVGSGGAVNAAADIARRFGPDGSTGVRLNVARRDGGTAVSGEDAELSLAAIGLDWRSRNVRLSGDLGWQENKLQQTRPNVSLGGVTAVPAAPDGSKNFAQPWSFSNERDVFGTLRGEWDINDSLTAYAAYGMRRSRELNSLANLQVNDATTGAGTTYRFDNGRRDRVDTGEIGLRGKLKTGSVGHEWVVSASHFSLEKDNAYGFDFLNSLATGLYRPTSYAQPAWSANAFFGGTVASPQLQGEVKLTSYAIGDTLSLLDDQLLITLGVRHQKLESTDYEYGGTGVVTGSYDKSRNTPVAGVLFKASKQLSVYANYIESLIQGGTAPATANNQPVVNIGTTLSPYVSRQKEIGLKYDAGRLGASAALFSITKPSAFTGTDQIFRASGEDEHRGLELATWGEAARGVKLLGGLTWLDAEQKTTGDAATQGKRVIGVPRVLANLGAEWELSAVRGLALDGRVLYTGASYVDAANTLRVPGWTRFDAGVRYLMEVQGKAVTLRARVDNLFDRKYWASSGGYPNSGYLVVGGPRTFSLSASVDF
ncbi:TonB-dependent siderophore receptor [Pseudorhodoferax sp. Leaf274]|uniref:TonB-dependent receptor n=1 Tax=Pseudorhodoferax sp. Leaf274 TaxID=1736318 RepID=UPI0007039085|nr:TonB-dependent receptor [Pseudorhodoferax sp. Leaf274]KQP50004.1 TonB-dependent receptor [Pseudorhodoferax sp. Leaf274]